MSRSAESRTPVGPLPDVDEVSIELKIQTDVGVREHVPRAEPDGGEQGDERGDGQADRDQPAGLERAFREVASSHALARCLSVEVEGPGAPRFAATHTAPGIGARRRARSG